LLKVDVIESLNDFVNEPENEDTVFV